MSKQTIALAYPRPADALEESEYQALAQALSESARGRSFLAEHARRSRSTETNILLTAIERIETQVKPRPPDREPLYDELRRVLDDIRMARERIEAGGKVPKAEQLNALLDILQRRIGKLLPPPASTQPAAEPAQEIVTPPPRPSAAHWLDTLPEPSLAGNDLGPPPAMPAIAKSEVSEASVPRMPPAATLKRAATQAPTFEIEAEIQSMVAAEVQAKAKNPFVPSAVEPTAAISAEDALAAIMALSEEERIALFS